MVKRAARSRKAARVLKVETPEVGEGAWVKVRPPRVGEQIEMAKMADMEEPTPEEIVSVLEATAGMVVDWNWVDDNGRPLPVPAEHPEIIKELYDDELIALTTAIGKVVEGIEKKDSE